MGERVLSIQSHVAYGYVGGKAAVFPLQCLGFDVDVVNTVNFSNHSGYGRFGGSRTSAQDLRTIFNTMKENGLLSQQRLLTGYIPNAEALSAIAELAKSLRAGNPEMIYLLDPVLGDSGKLYVAPDVIPIYRELLPQATIITPNWFEVETLTNISLTDIPSLRRALRVLHEEYRVPHVVMSSMPLQDFLRDALPAHILPHAPPSPKNTENASLAHSHLICISSSHGQPPQHRAAAARAEPGTEGERSASTVHAHVLPCIPGYFSGVGDLFSALILAHFHAPRPIAAPAPTSPAPPALSSAPPALSPDTLHTPLSISASLALSKTLAILRLTHAHVSAAPVPASPPLRDDATDEERDRLDPERRVRRQRARELRLVQGQDMLRCVPVGAASPGATAVAAAAGAAGAGAGAALAEASPTAELREMRAWDDFWTCASEPVLGS